MYFASIDCGSTNSRIYILDEKGVLLGKTFRSVGVRDTSIHGSNYHLKTNLECAFYEAVEAAGLDQRDISFVISAGMITSELGLLEVPHLWLQLQFLTLPSILRRFMIRKFSPSTFPFILFQV